MSSLPDIHLPAIGVARSTQSSRISVLRLAAWILLLIFSAECALRGPARLIADGYGFNDFISPFLQSQAWVKGLDPYSPQVLLQLWPDGIHWQFLAQHLKDGRMAREDGIPSPYPPTIFVLLAPLTVFSWRTTFIVLVCTSLLALGISLLVLTRLAGLRPLENKELFFCGLALGLAPVHTALATANPILFALSLGITGSYCAERQQASAAGVLLGLSTCIKPQLGAIFVAYYLIRRHWKTGFLASVIPVIAMLIAVARLLASHSAWQISYIANLHQMFGPGGINDFSTANPLSFQLVNLQVPMYALFHSVAGANGAAFLLAICLAGMWSMCLIRHASQSVLLELGAIHCIALLPVYHRSMDAAVLLLVLAWCVTPLAHPSKLSKWASLALIPFFLAPGSAVLYSLASSGQVSAKWTTSWIWQALLIPQQTWAILMLAIALLCAMWRRKPTPLNSPVLR